VWDDSSHNKNPQPCFAVSTAVVAPSAAKDATQLLTLSADGAKVAGWLLLQARPLTCSQPFQLTAVHDGSSSWKNVSLGRAGWGWRGERARGPGVVRRHAHRKVD